ncbi:MAG: amidase [Prolixibacteraceae bacterium]
MKRRSFFKTAALGSSIAVISPLAACSPEENQTNVISFVDFDLNEITVLQLQKMMKNEEITSVKIVQKYLKRIAEVDPYLKAMIEINPDAETIAAHMDEERRAGKVRGPLHGIPIVIKDNIDSGDKMMTTAGSMALNGFKAENDAFIVSKLREAGAVLLGKTNLSEWANIRSTNSSSGWSGRGGQVRNPYVLDRTPCGSSAGTGAAIAANLCTIGIGTETDGSIVCPSGTNGIVGIKPTLGSWSRHGIIPISHSQDTAGPMARTVADAAILLGALSAPHNYDEATLDSNRLNITDYTQFLDPDGLKGKRIGIARQLFGFNAQVDEQLNKSLEILKKQGAVLVDDLEFKERSEWNNAEWEVLLYELKADLNNYLAEHPNAPVKTLEEIIQYNIEHADVEMPWFGQEIFVEAQQKGDLNEEEYLSALKTSKELSRNAINKTMDENQLDAIIAPTNGPAWTIDWVNGDNYGGGSSDFAAISGYPNITVPAGYVHEIPLGLSFFGRAWSEPVLIEIAYAYEQASKFRKSPKFISSLLAYTADE